MVHEWTMDSKCICHAYHMLASEESAISPSSKVIGEGSHCTWHSVYARDHPMNIHIWGFELWIQPWAEWTCIRFTYELVAEIKVKHPSIYHTDTMSKRISTLDSYNLCISTPTVKLEIPIHVITKWDNSNKPVHRPKVYVELKVPTIGPHILGPRTWVPGSLFLFKIKSLWAPLSGGHNDDGPQTEGRGLPWNQ
jgi:hypothetical protein